MRKQIYVIIFLLIVLQLNCQAEPASAILQANLHIIPSDSVEVKTGKVQPGSQIALQAEIKNVGNKASAPGNLYLRFGLIEPMDDLLENRLFKTETVAVPRIFPEQVVILKFKKQHQWPSILDYVKQNWSMRQYQAVFIQENQKEQIIGYLPIFMSAHYYEGLRQVAPKKVISTE